jgi:nucleotide-binding universal stress UspA family protein
MFRILIPVDNHDFSEEVIPHVHDLVQRRDAQTTLLTILPDMIGFGHDEIAPAREAALMRLHEFHERLGVSVTKVGYALRMGDAAEEILKYDALEPATLIAMPTHGRKGITRVVDGSVAEKVLRRTHTPMLLSHRNAAQPVRAEDNRYQTILVALDGSRAGEQVLPAVEEIAITHGSAVVLFHDFAGVSDMGEPLGLKHVKGKLERYRERLEKAGIEASIETTRTGRPAESILHRIADHPVDLVAMSTGGREGLTRIAFGSVAENVLRHCGTAMLLQSTAPSRSEALRERYLG